MNGTISKTKELAQENKSSVWVFGALLALGLVNLVCCTPVYLGVIGWLAGKVMGSE